MALLSVIRRWHFREGMPIREIERRTGLSRNTIRKYLRSGTVEPRFKVADRPSKLDQFAEKLSGWLKIETGKSRKQRRTVKQMHAAACGSPHIPFGPSFPDLDALNAWLEEQCIAHWGQIVHGAMPGTVADVHAGEVARLMPMGRSFDGFVEHTKALLSACLGRQSKGAYRQPAW